MMRENGLMPFPIVFTGGTGEARPVYADFGKVFWILIIRPGSGAQVLKEMHVPKEDLVHAGMIIMQQGRMRLAEKPASMWMDFKACKVTVQGAVNEKRTQGATTTRPTTFTTISSSPTSWQLGGSPTAGSPQKERVIHTENTTEWNPYDVLEGGYR